MRPERGDIWFTDLGEPLGPEAGSQRPALIVSNSNLHSAGLAVVCAITRTRLGYPSHVEIDPEQSGLLRTCYVQAEQVHTISTSRLTRRLGSLGVVPMTKVENVLRLLLDL